jgi:hypothetical protein
MATVPFRTALLTAALASLIVPALSAQKTKVKPAPDDDSRTEMRLRMRLNVNPHDKEAHKQLEAIFD